MVLLVFHMKERVYSILLLPFVLDQKDVTVCIAVEYPDAFTWPMRYSYSKSLRASSFQPIDATKCHMLSHLFVLQGSRELVNSYYLKLSATKNLIIPHCYSFSITLPVQIT